MSTIPVILASLAYLFLAQAAEPGVVSVPAQPAPEAAVASDADERHPILLELFTSQGCGLCPEANRFLGEFDQERDDVIVLAFAVDYWDMYGWADIYARPEYVQRQRAYLPRLGQSRLFTPHFVIDGADDAESWSRDLVRDAVDDRSDALIEAGALDIEIEIADGPFGARRILIGGTAPEEELDVWLAAYQPNWKSHVIEGGENAGEEMLHYNMVKSLTYLGQWEGGEAEFMGEAFERYGAVVIVQGERGGPVYALAHEPAAFEDERDFDSER